jgi:hypothetical protein
MSLLQGPFGATNSIKFYDESTSLRIYDVAGDVQSFKNLTPEPADDTTGDPSRFTMTVTEVGAGDTLAVNSVAAGSWLTITTAANEYDGINLQAKGEAFKLETGKPLYFGAKLAINDATQSDLLIGLMETNTALMAVETAHGIGAANIEGAFFVKLDGTTTVMAKTYEANVQTNSANWGTTLNTSTHIYEIVWDGAGQLGFYVDGTIVACFTGTLPNGDLTPSINFRAGAAAAKVCEVHWMRVFQARS